MQRRTLHYTVGGASAVNSDYFGETACSIEERNVNDLSKKAKNGSAHEDCAVDSAASLIYMLAAAAQGLRPLNSLMND